MPDNNQNPEDETNQIKELLEINKPTQSIESELRELLMIRSSLFAENGPCSGIPLEPFPEQYFVAQEFNETKNDLRETLAASFKELGFSPISAEDFMWTENILCKIAALIQGTPFGVYQLSTSQNRNVYLELGIAVGLHKPFVLVKDREAVPATIVRDIEYYQIDDYLSARHELGELLEKYITSIGRYPPRELSNRISMQNAVISHWESDSVDISITIARQLKSSGYNPIIIGKRDQKLEKYLISDVKIAAPQFAETRDEIFKAVKTSKFGVFHVDKPKSANNFLALGIAIGLNRPFLPIKHLRNEAPNDLNYLSPLVYSGFTNLEKNLRIRFPDWLSKLDNQES